MAYPRDGHGGVIPTVLGTHLPPTTYTRLKRLTTWWAFNMIRRVLKCRRRRAHGQVICELASHGSKQVNCQVNEPSRERFSLDDRAPTLPVRHAGSLSKTSRTKLIRWVVFTTSVPLPA